MLTEVASKFKIKFNCDIVILASILDCVSKSDNNSAIYELINVLVV